MDSLVVMKLVQTRDLARSIYASIVKKITYLMSLHESCITHVSRMKNKVSDCLANFARWQNHGLVFSPPDVVELAPTDVNNIVIE